MENRSDMTYEEVIRLLSERYCSDFADEASRRIREADAVGLLYEAATVPCGALPNPMRHKVLWRAAYVLERIYFGSRESFMPCAERFCRTGFPGCTDRGARRHFGKIMADLLGRAELRPAELERIAETAAEWAVDPGSKTAVRIWAIEVLKCCRRRIGWVEESWPDLMEAMSRENSPGIAARLRNSWREIR